VFVESLAVVGDTFIVMGDFNLHVDGSSSIPAKEVFDYDGILWLLSICDGSNA
jgi:hypothetical protein